jgi:D-alanyl-D-alanine carboxypeptidase
MTRRLRAGLAALALLATPVAAQQVDQTTLDAAARTRVTQAIERSGFVGTYAVYAGPRRIAGGSVGPAVEGQPGGFGDEALWPWGRIGRQIAATLAMQEVEAGRLSLDAPLGRYLPMAARGTTLRRSIAAGDAASVVAVLERATRQSFADLFAQRVAGPLGLTAHVVGAPGGVDEHWSGGPTEAERQVIARQPVADTLEGTATDLATIDRALLSGALLSNGARADLWRSLPTHRSVVLAGCGGAQEIVDEAGGGGRFAVRNLILPAQGLSVVLLTNRRAPDGTDGLGPVGQGRGLAIARAAACA